MSTREFSYTSRLAAMNTMPATTSAATLSPYSKPDAIATIPPRTAGVPAMSPVN
jgi:hypothetical protein